MIVVEKKQIETIPLLHVVNQKNSHEKLPTIFFMHGFTSAKEHNLHYAYLLAEQGFRVLMPDALYHGEREKSLSEIELYVHFWEIVLKTIHEVNILKEHFEEYGLINSEKIGFSGTSMGGIVALGALTKYKWIKAAVSLMGMPSYKEFSLWQIKQLQQQGINLPFTESQMEEQLVVLREYDLNQQADKLENRPLLFWHGKMDQVVPFDLTYEFYESIKKDYASTEDKLKFIVDERADHKVSREGLKATIEWFAKHLLI